ncbi:hypothetical protein ACFY3N_02505 [Streptomyces sp. NPDC000348]|uniref:hypothetical protein n=1 Tax=Streptomyces sp. NPDC000348 TaxID=3364538 RepID=UPI0036C99A59
MADEQHRWLDRGTAERLLSGESPETTDPAARDQARRLAATLRALSAPPPPDGAELPGEAAALAAFRTAREEREGAGETARGADHPAGTRPSDIGPIHIGAPRGDRSGTADGPRRRRFPHLGLAAAMVAGMVGGAAVLAGTGILSAPSDGSRSDPAASVTATGTHPERPLVSPPPKGGAPGGATPGGRHPEGAAGTAEDGVGAAGDADGSRAPGEPGAETGDGAARSGHDGKRIAAACRAWRDGEALNGERERLLEDAAGGSSRVGPYCEDVLSTPDAPGASDESGTSGASGAGEGAPGGNGNGKADGRSEGQGQGQGQGRGNGGSSAEKGTSGTSGTSGNKGEGGKKNP